jgi:hypothetical protein
MRFQVPNRTNDQELSRARFYHRLSIVTAIVLFSALVVGFGLQWKPWFQAPIILGAWIAVEWQRRAGRKMKALLDPQVRQGSLKTG